MQKPPETIRFTKAALIQDITYYREAFSTIESLDLTTYDYTALKQLIEGHFKIPLFQAYYPKNQEPFTFYRVRKAAGFQDGFTLVSSYSMPPPNIAAKGRANFAGAPVFYCAALPQTAVAECHLQEGEEIYLSIWRLKVGEELGTSSFLKNGETLPQKWNSIFKIYQQQLDRKMTTYSEGTVESIWYINNKLSNWFLKPNDYLLSAFLGHSFLYDTNLSKYNMSADCILYPSIAQQQEGINFAFSPSGLQKLELKEVYHCRYNNTAVKGVNVAMIKSGKPDSKQERIIWHAP